MFYAISIKIFLIFLHFRLAFCVFVVYIRGVARKKGLKFGRGCRMEGRKKGRDER